MTVYQRASAGAQWVDLSLAATWQTQSGYGTPRLRVINGRVELAGVLQRITSTVAVATLATIAVAPAGAVPAVAAIMGTSGYFGSTPGDEACQIRVTTGGTISYYCNTGGSTLPVNGYIMLEGLSHALTS